MCKVGSENMVVESVPRKAVESDVQVVEKQNKKELKSIFKETETLPIRHLNIKAGKHAVQNYLQKKIIQL